MVRNKFDVLYFHVKSIVALLENIKMAARISSFFCRCHDGHRAPGTVNNKIRSELTVHKLGTLLGPVKKDNGAPGHTVAFGSMEPENKKKTSQGGY